MGEKSLRRQFGLALLGTSCAVYGVFFLPYRFPGTIPTFSHSYLAGYSNRVASLSVIAISLAVFAIGWLVLRAQEASPQPETSLPKGYLWAGAAVYAVLHSALSYGALQSPHYYGETTYFLLGLDRMIHAGQVPYRDFEFAYGCLQLYLPMAVHWLLQPLHAAIDLSYFLTVIATNVAGVAILYQIVASKALALVPKRAVFVLVAFGMLNPTLGMNYTPVRFLIAPYLLLLLFKRIANNGTTLDLSLFTGLASVAAWSTSPEAGVAYSGASALLFVITQRPGSRMLAAIPCCGLGFVLMLAIFGGGYFSAILAFSAGMGNLLIVPAPYILFFLLTAVCVVPIGLALAWRGQPNNAPLLLAFGATGMVYLSAALGRCDPGHVFCNGICLFLLAFVLIAKYYRRLQLSYLFFFALVFPIAMHFGGDITYLGQIRLLIAYATRAPIPADLAVPSDYSALDKVSGIATPFMLDRPIEAYLSSHGKLAPEPIIQMTNVFDPQAVEKKIEGLAAAPYVLADLDRCCYEDPAELIEMVTLYPLKYTPRHEAYSPGEAVAAFIQNHFDEVAKTGDYTLYRNRAHQ